MDDGWIGLMHDKRFLFFAASHVSSDVTTREIMSKRINRKEYLGAAGATLTGMAIGRNAQESSAANPHKFRKHKSPGNDSKSVGKILTLAGMRRR